MITIVTDSIDVEARIRGLSDDIRYHTKRLRRRRCPELIRRIGRTAVKAAKEEIRQLRHGEQ